jgi:multiple sugar transport system ATP-binding protein
MNFLKGSLENGDGLAFQGEAGRLGLSSEQASRLGEYSGRQVYLGIRPEDVYGPDHLPDLPAGQSIQTEVDVIEPMGNELFVYANAGSAQFVARVDPRQKTRVGETLPMTLDMSKAHFFDAESEEQIV